ncbi:MAG: hypothetical protein U0168_30605 [Nannocystaceae bacterium]
MEIVTVLLPFMLPLLLLGSIVSRMGERRFDAMRELPRARPGASPGALPRPRALDTAAPPTARSRCRARDAERVDAVGHGDADPGIAALPHLAGHALALAVEHQAQPRR